MRSIFSLFASLTLVAGVAVACGGASSTPGAPSSTPTAAPTAASLAAIAPTPMPSTDGTGDEYVTGSGSFSIVTSGTSKQVGDITQIRGFVATSIDTMNDPRVSGVGMLNLNLDVFSKVGTEWGSLRLESTWGAWEGTVWGASWNDGNSSELSGWLAGSGAYKGYTYYIHSRSTVTATETDGVIFRGSWPPLP